MKKVLVLLWAVLAGSMIEAQEYVPSPENLEAREWFQDAKFGLFIHWGVYSNLGDGEWVMNNQGISVDRYELLPTFFDPTEFDAAAIVGMAKAAGMKYITFTSKHHDGFAMYHSKVSKYNVVEASPYKKDILAQLAAECKKQGIKLFIYYSQLDWHHPDYYPRGSTGNKTGRPESGNWEDYLTFQNAQIEEIATNYEIAGFWFDGWWDQSPTKKGDQKITYTGNDWDLATTYNMIHKVNPALLIGNNHHELPFEGEDFQMFEKDLPGKNTTGFGNTHIGKLPLETCETINNSWGFNLQDDKHKSVGELVRYLVRAAGNNANFLLNVGPMPNGKIQKEHMERLRAVGEWLEKNGATIYGSRGSDLVLEENMVATTKDNKIYLHLLELGTDQVNISNFDGRIKEFMSFADREPVRYTLKKGVLSFTIDKEKMNGVDTILEITLK
ncbi:MAG: alpha-L-fucosidase [Sediminicola sp.]